MGPVIRLAGVTKAYRLVHQRPFLARELWRRLLQKPSRTETFTALRDVSFEIERGEAVGVIGTNGSGKSTLLSLIARTSYPTAGTVEVEGRVGPLLELGAGFHPDLTGRENIFLNASLLGLSRAEVETRLESIIDYSGIRTFIDSPIQTYSTGMTARLGFSVVAHTDPDILLVDEVFAVGDADFQQRCEETIRGMIARGATLFLVSHDMRVVREICSKVIWIEEGRVREIGDPAKVVERYLHSAQPVGAG